MNSCGADGAYEKLLAELRAIERWDQEYYTNSDHDRSEREAYQRRQERRHEIMAEVLKARPSSRVLATTGDWEKFSSAANRGST